MTTESKTKSRFNEVLLTIDARRFHENTQQQSIDCLKPRSNKNELECKKCGCNEFYVPNDLICNTAHFVMYNNGNIVKS